jgi:O-antigen/teichoic acid export membrane protein
MQEYKRFTKDVVVVAVAQAVLALRGLLFIPILAKTLGASLYGVYSTLMVTVTLLTPIAQLGLLSSLVRFLAAEKNKDEIRESYYSVLSVVFLSSLFLSSILFFSSDYLMETLFKDPGAIGIIKIGIFLILTWSLDSVNLEFLRASRRMFKYSFFLILQTIGEIILAAVLVFNGFGLDAVIYAFLFVRSIVFLATFVAISREIPWKTPNFSKIKPYLIFGLPFVATFLFSWVMNSFDRYAIAYLLDFSQVGIYSAAYGIASVTALFMTPLSTVLFPVTSKLWEERRLIELKNHMRYSLKYFLLFAIPGVFGLSVLSQQILAILTKQEFVSSGYVVLIIIAFATLCYLASSIWTWIFIMAKKTHYLAIFSCVGAILNIVLNAVLVPKMGIIGAAISTLVPFMLLSILNITISQRYFSFPIDLVFIVKSLAASFVMALVLLAWSPVAFMDVFFSIALCAALYFVVLFLLRGFDRTELDFFVGFIASVRSYLLHPSKKNVQ